MGVRFRRLAGGLTLAVVLAGQLAGCGKSGKGTFHPSGSVSSASDRPVVAGPSGTTGSVSASNGTASPLPAPSTMTTPQLKTSVLDTYRAYMAAYEAAYETNDPSGLGPYAMDPVLGRVTAELQAQAKAGVIWRFHNVLNPQLQGETKDRTLVLVLDCVQDLGSYEYSLANGARIATKQAANNYFQAEVKYVQGGWKVSDTKVGNRC